MMMKDDDKPVVTVQLDAKSATASVIVTFPFASQAYAFRDVVAKILEKIPEIAKPQDL